MRMFKVEGSNAVINELKLRKMYADKVTSSPDLDGVSFNVYSRSQKDVIPLYEYNAYVPYKDGSGFQKVNFFVEGGDEIVLYGTVFDYLEERGIKEKVDLDKIIFEVVKYEWCEM